MNTVSIQSVAINRNEGPDQQDPKTKHQFMHWKSHGSPNAESSVKQGQV